MTSQEHDATIAATSKVLGDVATRITTTMDPRAACATYDKVCSAAADVISAYKAALKAARSESKAGEEALRDALKTGFALVICPDGKDKLIVGYVEAEELAKALKTPDENGDTIGGATFELGGTAVDRLKDGFLEKAAEAWAVIGPIFKDD